MSDQAKLEKLFKTVMGENVHTAFRKGCDDPSSVIVWNAIQKMPRKAWGECVSWMSWALAYSLHNKLKIAAQPSASEGERVEHRLGTATVFRGGRSKLLWVDLEQPHGPQSLEIPETFHDGDQIEIIARLVPTKGGADHE